MSEFWKSVIASRLLTPEQCQQLASAYQQTVGPLDAANAQAFVDWLTRVNVLSRYQATVLLNGRSGPFFYGEYKLYDRIESGRWKGVFRAVHAPTNHPVLLQFATGPATQDPQHWAFVVSQVHNRLAAPFPYWHRYYEVVDLGSFKFLVAEELAGESLDQRLTQVGRIAWQDACAWTRHVALALTQLHRWQLPHADIRPANVWLDAQGHCRLLQDPTQLPSPWPVQAVDTDGTLATRADYAAPELQQAGKVPDAQSDIYALGCCLFQMITGQPPFAGGDVARKFQRHASEPIQSLAPYGVPEQLAQVIAYMMAKNPAVRFPSAQAVADQLSPFIDPARLNVGNLAVTPTLPLYEQFVQQRGLGRTSDAFTAEAASAARQAETASRSLSPSPQQPAPQAAPQPSQHATQSVPQSNQYPPQQPSQTPMHGGPPSGPSSGPPTSRQPKAGAGAASSRSQPTSAASPQAGAAARSQPTGIGPAAMQAAQAAHAAQMAAQAGQATQAARVSGGVGPTGSPQVAPSGPTPSANAAARGVSGPPQSSMASKMPRPVGNAAPAPGMQTGGAPMGGAPTGGPQAGGQQMGGPQVGGPQVVGQQGGVSPMPLSPGGSPAAGATRGKSKLTNQQMMLFGGLAGGAVLAVVALIVILASGGDGEPSPDGTGQATTIAGTEATPNGQAGTVAGTNTPTGPSGTGTAATVNPAGKAGASGTPATPASVARVVPRVGKGADNRGEKGGAGGTMLGKGEPGKGGADAPVVATPALKQTVIPDDGKALWESPTSGGPVEFNWVPPGGQLFIAIRPSEWLGSPEGARVVRALGPAWETAIVDWEKAAGVNFQDVERMIVTLHDNGEAFPRASVVVYAKEALVIDELTAKWGAQPDKETPKAVVYRGSGWNYCVPRGEGNRIFLMGAPEEVTEASKIGGAPPALRREIERLRRLTDVDRHFTLLVAPNYLASAMFRDGRSFYFGDAKKVREPLDWFLRDELQSVSVSLHTAGDTFVEMRLTSNLNKEPYKLAGELRDRLEQVPDVAFDYIATLGTNPYWERVRLQFPNMIRFMHKQSRIGVEDDTATINTRLPGPAAHNLAFGAEMLLMSAPGAVAVSAVASKGGGTAAGGLQPAKMTVDDILAQFKTTIAFEAQSLELALQDIARDVNEQLKGLPFEFKIKIMGEDLRLDGITRNQTVRDFNQRDKPLGEVLTAMVRKANPVTTVKDPSEKDQKLLWVVEKDPDDPSKTVVLITTRQVSDQKKYKLPTVFQLK
jgi:serine/threonine protein kinase